MDSEQLLQELQKLPSDRGLTFKGSEAWIICPNPDHAGGHEHTPSCKISLSEPYTGRVFCFGCGLSEGWNYLARMYHLAGIDKSYKAIGVRNTSFRKHKPELKYDKNDDEYFQQRFPWPESREWRGIPGKYLNLINAYVPQVRKVNETPHVVLPVHMYGEEVGHVRALLEDPKRDPKTGKKLQDSYINMRGSWVEKSFFGFDYATRKGIKHKPLWLVEGPRDVFKCWMAGIRAIGVLGKNFSEYQLEILRLTNPPVVVIATDNDEAGNRGADDIRDLTSEYLKCVRVKFKYGEDVFDQSVDKLKAKNALVVEKYC